MQKDGPAVISSAQAQALASGFIPRVSFYSPLSPELRPNREMAMSQAEQVVCLGPLEAPHPVAAWKEDASSGFLSSDTYFPDGNRQLLSSKPFGLSPLGLAHEKRRARSSQC